GRSVLQPPAERAALGRPAGTGLERVDQLERQPRGPAGVDQVRHPESVGEPPGGHARGRVSILRSCTVLVLVALVAACAGSSGGSSEAHRSPAALDGCVRGGAATAIVKVRAGGERFAAAVLGRGPTGVVLANESDLDLCAWL